MSSDDQILKGKEGEVFQKYIENRKVLIADSNAAARSSIFNVLRELGTKPNQLSLANSYAAGAQQLLEIKPHIVISEYDLGKRCGLELLQSQREQRPKETKECIFIIVTNNTSQTAAARALEEDIDAYIIKPYTLEYVRNTILKAAMYKMHPPAYFQKIEEGKAFMSQGKLSEAEKMFQEATTLEQVPSLAYYYLGQVNFIKTIVHSAQSNYMKGLKLNNIHYKCLIGIYELFMHEKRYPEAYDIVKKVSRYFPANPKRLTEVLRLAIMTRQFEDIERYYQIFINMDIRNETLVKYATAALVVCGKYYLSANLGTGKAIDLFKKAAATSSNSSRILSEIIPILLEHGLVKEVTYFFERFPPEKQTSNEFIFMKMLYANSENKFNKVVEHGRFLITQNFKDPKLYEVLIKTYFQLKMDSAGEDLVYVAGAKFPDRKEAFLKLIPTKKVS